MAVCEERILKRATDGGRADDNLGIFHYYIFHCRPFMRMSLYRPEIHGPSCPNWSEICNFCWSGLIFGNFSRSRPRFIIFSMTRPIGFRPWIPDTRSIFVENKKETLRKRFKSYEEIQFPIIDYYIKNGLCEEIKTEGTRDENILKINNLMKSKNLLP